MKKKTGGRFKPGQSGNPNGRPKGSKNQITLLKESLELQLREKSEGHMAAVLEKALELALAGDRAMIKLLLEMHMSKGTSNDNSKGIEKVEIKVSGPETEVKKEVQPTVQDPQVADSRVIN
jgi:hypothetical protein